MTKLKKLKEQPQQILSKRFAKIILMKTVGQILKTERKKQDKTILQIHKITKIPEEKLKALEADNFTLLPPAIFTKGYIKNYALVLGLEPKKLIAVFRRDWQESKKGEIVPKGLAQSLNKQAFGWTPKITLIVAVTTIVFLFLSYIGFQIKNYFSLPTLIVAKPEDNQYFKQDIIEVSGQVNKNTAVYINDQLINVDNEGNFTYQLKVFAGENTIEVKAVNRRGKETLVFKKIVVDKED